MTEQGEPLSVGLAEQIAEVERELAVREMMYPLWVINKRISKRAAERQMRRLLAVRETLRRLVCA